MVLVRGPRELLRAVGRYRMQRQLATVQLPLAAPVRGTRGVGSIHETERAVRVDGERHLRGPLRILRTTTNTVDAGLEGGGGYITARYAGRKTEEGRDGCEESKGLHGCSTGGV